MLSYESTIPEIIEYLNYLYLNDLIKIVDLNTEENKYSKFAGSYPFVLRINGKVRIDTKYLIENYNTFCPPNSYIFYITSSKNHKTLMIINKNEIDFIAELRNNILHIEYYENHMLNYNKELEFPLIKDDIFSLSTIIDTEVLNYVNDLYDIMFKIERKYG